jgi:hypothetical protein
MEVIPLSDMSAAACAKALAYTWISRFGVPQTITSDRGLQFTSNLWFKLCAPKTASARERPMSSLGRARRPRSTKGNSSDQAAAAARARRAS